MVYTRVHFPLLGSGYVIGLYMSRVQMFLSSVYASRLPCPRALVISCLGPSRTLYLDTQEIRGVRE